MRSIRAGNFTLYIQSLTKHVHWFFTVDHYHYVRWISVHVREVMTLSGPPPWPSGSSVGHFNHVDAAVSGRS